MERELRRYQNLLVCVGTGIIMFGFWSLIKGVMMIIFYKDDIIELMTALGTPKEDLSWLLPFVNVMIVGVICADLVLRMIVGLSAQNEGRDRGTQGRWLYLVFGMMLTIIQVGSLVGNLTSFDESFTNFLDGIITLVIDVTSVVMMVEMFVAGARVKYLKRKIRRAKAEEVAA